MQFAISRAIDVIGRRMKGPGQVRFLYGIRRSGIKLFRIQSTTAEIDEDTIASLFGKVWQTTSLLTGHSSPDYLYVFCPPGVYTRLEANIRGRHGANIRGRLRLRL